VDVVIDVDSVAAGRGPETSAQAGPDKKSRISISDVIERYTGVLVLIALILVFSIAKPDTFLTYDNIVGVIANGAVTGIIALGLLLPLAAGVFDISVAGTLTLSVVGIMVLFEETSGKMPIIVAVLIVLLCAVVVGLINAFGILNLKIDPFIITIGTSSLLVGFSQLIANGSTITTGIPSRFVAIGRSSYLHVPISVYVFGILALALWYLLRYTPFGRMLYATGASREAARLAGVKTSRIIRLAMVGSAAGGAIAGIVLAARLGSGPPGLGDGYLIGAYASAFLGSTIITPGRFNVVGLVVATLIIGVGVNGLQLMGTPFWVVPIFQGAALLVAVTLGSVRSALRSKA
jgi:ribose transport system permease protein